MRISSKTLIDLSILCWTRDSGDNMVDRSAIVMPLISAGSIAARVFTKGFDGMARIVAVLTILFFAISSAGAKPKQASSGVDNRTASILVDAASGAILHQANADALRYPASLTKIMTLYMVFDALDDGLLRLDQRIKTSPLAARQQPSKLGLAAGETIRVEDAILGLVTKSANDASVVLAEAVAGSEAEFALRMTAKARALGMTRTTFRNASGLPDRLQQTTARDMATLALAMLRDHKRRYGYFSRSEFTYDGAVHANHNRLLNAYEGMDGIKTGFINASGFNLVASATRDGRRLVGVVFGGNTAALRDREMVRLMDAGFNGRPFASPPATLMVKNGETEEGAWARVSSGPAGAQSGLYRARRDRRARVGVRRAGRRLRPVAGGGERGEAGGQAGPRAVGQSDRGRPDRQQEQALSRPYRRPVAAGSSERLQGAQDEGRRLPGRHPLIPTR